MSLTAGPARVADADHRREQRSRFTTGRKAEAHYAAQLRKIARHVGDIISAFPAGDPEALAMIETALQRYSETLEPWGYAVARRMIEDVSRRDYGAWIAHSREIGGAIRMELIQNPSGELLRQLLGEQVELIRSIPLQAAQRVHHFTVEGLITGRRADSLAQQIADTTGVTRSRATLIARTETTRTATLFTQARAQGFGSDGYVWRTAHDASVRPSHHRMEGKFVRWDAPPTLDGMVGHAGAFPNCRCFPEVIVPEARR